MLCQLIQLYSCGWNQAGTFIKIFKAWHLLLLFLREGNYFCHNWWLYFKNHAHQIKHRPFLFFFFIYLFLLLFLIVEWFIGGKQNRQQFKVSEMFSVTFIMLDFWLHWDRGRQFWCQLDIQLVSGECWDSKHSKGKK